MKIENLIRDKYKNLISKMVLVMKDEDRLTNEEPEFIAY